MATVDSDQLEIAKKFAAALTQIESLQANIEKSYSNQIKLAQQLSDITSNAPKSGLQDELGGITKALQDIATNFDKFDKNLNSAFNSVNKNAVNVAKNLNVIKNTKTEPLEKGFRNLSATLKNFDTSRAFRGVSDDMLRSVGSNAKLIKSIEDTIGISKVLNVVGFKGLARAFKNPLEASKSLHINNEKLVKDFEKKLPKSLIVFGAALTGLVQGFRNVIGLGKGILGFMSSFADAAINITGAILSIPLQIFTGIVDIADKANIDISELLNAIENLRKSFGDLRGPTNKAIKDVSINLTGFKDTGLSTWRVFGTLAERLQYIQPIVEAMGATFQVLRKEFEENGGALLAYQKGLGLSAEQMQEMGSRAISMGDTLATTFKGISKYALDLGKTFKIDSKILSRDMAKAMGDVKHFANLSNKELGIAVVYAKKLGVELDKITGTLDAFETFDTAAENVSKLSQSFGVQVDAFELLEAQNPADQIDKLRTAFKNAGQDASTFSRQQLKLISQSTGLDEATARQVFSAKNYGVSLDQIKKKSAEAEKKTLTQAEAMAKLASNIERLVKAQGGPGGGFVDHFLKGMLQGIQVTKEFRGTIMDIRRDLRLAEFAGVKVGKEFVKAFPGVADFFQGLRDVFDPKRFSKFTSEIVKIFTGFFKELNSGKFSFANFIEKLQNSFLKEFSAGDKGMGMIKTGFMKFATALRDLFIQALDWSSKQIAKFIDQSASFINDPGSFFDNAKVQASSLASKVFLFFEPVVKAIEKAVEVLWPPFKRLIAALFERVKQFLKSSEFKAIIAPLKPLFAAVFLGPIVSNSLSAAFTTALIKSATSVAGSSALKSGLGKGLSKVGTTVAEGLSKATGKAITSGAVGIVASIALLGLAVSDGMEKYTAGITGDFSDAEKEIGAGTAGIVNMLTLGLLPDGIAQSIAQNLTELVSMMKDGFNKIVGGLGTDLVSTNGALFQALGGIGSFISGIFEGNIDKVTDGIEDFFRGIAGFAVNMFLTLPGKILVGALKFSIQFTQILLGAFAGVVERIAHYFGFDAVATIAGSVKDFFKSSTSIVGDVFNKFGNQMTEVFSFITSKITGKTIEATKQATDGAKDVTAAASKSLEQSKIDFNKDPTGFVNVASSVVDGIKNIKETLGTIKISEVADSLQQLNQIKLPDLDSKATKSIEGYASFFQNYAEFVSSVSSASETIKKKAVASSVNAVQDMIKIANQLQTALSDGNLNTLDISTKLNRVSAAAGLGSKSQYSIKNKDVVINLNLSVYMDVAEVERVIITQRKSVIRDRLNTLGETNAQTANQPSFPIKPNTTPALIKGGE